ncbi:MAG TPA: GNAT family N-acetyltransferase [Devosiaceae bacterium]|jgi:RimJ/RimL family protein N-acetyltransferase
MSIELKSDRLTLRLPQQDDAERIARYLNDFAVAGNLARVPFPYYLSDAEAWLHTRRDDLEPEETNFAIDLAGEGLVGHVGYHPGQDGNTILGYWLGEPFWNRGIMTEAAAMAIDWYFSVTLAETVNSGVFAFNQASLAVQKKLGFTEIGTSSLHCLARNAEVSHIDTLLTRKAWMESSRK